MLDILERHGSEGAFDNFTEALRKDYAWLATQLEQHHPYNGVDKVDRFVNDTNQVYHDTLALGNVPRLPKMYVARDVQIKQVQEALKKIKRNNYVALCGMTGCGKSVLAAACVRDEELLAKHCDMHVFWLGAGMALTSEDATILLHQLGRMIDPGFIHETPELMKIELRRILATPEFSNALIILDDWCLKDGFSLFDLGCKMLVTTQIIDLVKEISNVQVIELVTGFTLDETLELFSRCTNIKVKQLPNEAKYIHELCKGAPLTISLLGSMMEPHNCEATDVQRWKYYVDMIKDKKDGYVLI